jgi:hypothetical protein
MLKLLLPQQPLRHDTQRLQRPASIRNMPHKGGYSPKVPLNRQSDFLSKLLKKTKAPMQNVPRPTVLVNFCNDR